MNEITAVIIVSIAAILFFVFGIISVIHPELTTNWGKKKVMPFLYTPSMLINKVIGINTKLHFNYQPNATKKELIAARIIGVVAILCGSLSVLLLVSACINSF
jgi:hypothetical protein